MRDKRRYNGYVFWLFSGGAPASQPTSQGGGGVPKPPSHPAAARRSSVVVCNMMGLDVPQEIEARPLTRLPGAKCKSHILGGFRLTSVCFSQMTLALTTCLNNCIRACTSFKRHTTGQWLIGHIAAAMSWYIWCICCDLIRLHGDGLVAMGLAVVGTKLNSESKEVRVLEKNRIYRAVKIILPYSKSIFTVPQKTIGTVKMFLPYGRIHFAVR